MTHQCADSQCARTDTTRISDTSGIWACPDHFEKYKKRNQQYRTFKKRHPYRKTITYQNMRAKRMGASGTFTERQWLNLLEQWDHRCASCRSPHNIVIDHIVPLSAGGTNDISNIQPLCTHCNNHKHDTVPGPVPLVNLQAKRFVKLSLIAIQAVEERRLDGEDFSTALDRILSALPVLAPLPAQE